MWPFGNVNLEELEIKIARGVAEAHIDLTWRKFPAASIAARWNSSVLGMKPEMKPY